MNYRFYMSLCVFVYEKYFERSNIDLMIYMFYFEIFFLDCKFFKEFLYLWGKCISGYFVCICYKNIVKCISGF